MLKDPLYLSDDGTFKDHRDKKVYKWVRIGEQVWMAENLAFLPSVSPSSVGSETAKYYYVYGYEETSIREAKNLTNCITYGVLYNWPETMTGASSSKESPSGVQGICPLGWHLPSDGEWKVLETYLGMSQADVDDFRYRASGSVGYALKSTSGWHNEGNGDNRSGFNALLGGFRYRDGGFVNLSNNGYFWSTCEDGVLYIWLRNLSHDKGGVSRLSYFKGHGLSVRCLKN